MISHTRLKWETVTLVGTLFGGALFALGQKEASAGAKTTQGVTIYTSSRAAIGALGSVRNDSSGVEYIYCGTSRYSGTATPYVFCEVKMAGSGSPSASCISSDSKLVDEGRSISGDSYIEFDWDTAGTCTYIQVRADSRYEPKL